MTATDTVGSSASLLATVRPDVPPPMILLVSFCDLTATLEMQPRAYHIMVGCIDTRDPREFFWQGRDDCSSATNAKQGEEDSGNLEKMQ